MQNKNIIKYIAVGVVCLVVLALIGLSIAQHQKFKELSRKDSSKMSANEFTTGATSTGIQSEQKNITKTIALTDKGKSANKDDADSLKEQLTSTEQELDTANNKLSAEISRKAELKKKELELQKQFANDPSMKKYMRASLDTQYGSIFKELNLSPEKIEKLKDLLVDHMMAQSALSPEIINASTKEQKTELQKRYDVLIDEKESKIKELLGNTDYEKYQEFNEKATTRAIINSFKETLSSDNQLTKGQEKDLTDVMYKEQMKVFSEMGYDPRKTIEFRSDIKEGKVDGQLKNMEKIQSRSIENSKGILSDSQLEQFKNYLKNQREMMELSSKLSNQ
jgi:hypothetical protein